MRTIHSYVSRLRSILGDEGGRDLLVRRDPGYVLDVDPTSVDVARFERLVGDGLAALDDDDPAAAMRYTEARLSRMAVELLTDLDKETVDFVPNYDDSEQEPSVLPAKYPQLLVNGSGGIPRLTVAMKGRPCNDSPSSLWS